MSATAKATKAWHKASTFKVLTAAATGNALLVLVIIHMRVKTT
jgi:hypothetical protein